MSSESDTEATINPHRAVTEEVVNTIKDTLAETRVNPLETNVLLAIAIASEDEDETAYAPSIHRLIYRGTGRDLSLHSIYITLTRLESKGLISSEFDEPRAKQGGRRRRTYKLTRVGKAHLSSAREVFDGQHRLWQQVSATLSS